MASKRQNRRVRNKTEGSHLEAEKRAFLLSKITLQIPAYRTRELSGSAVTSAVISVIYVL